MSSFCSPNVENQNQYPSTMSYGNGHSNGPTNYPQYHGQNDQPEMPYWPTPPAPVSFSMPPQMGSHYQSRGEYAPQPRQKVSPLSIVQTAKDFVVNQEVEVLLRGNSWVIGLVVGTLEFLHRISGKGYRVKYRSLSGHFEVQPFSPECIRPHEGRHGDHFQTVN